MSTNDPSQKDLLLGQWYSDLAIARTRVKKQPLTRQRGRLVRAAGLVLEAVGLNLPMGTLCAIELADGQHHAEAEVVGFADGRLFLMPFVETAGLLPGARVWANDPISGESSMSGKQLPVGDNLLGRVLDARGAPLDRLGQLKQCDSASLIAPYINPLQRAPVNQVLDVGIKAINALLTVGRGQRLGLFAGSGVGKSVLLGMMARYTSADVIVVGLIGERGREVKDFVDNILGPEGRKRAVVVAAPADSSALLRLQGADYAARLAEHFRAQGKDVLLLMDSLTRYAMAQREIALAIGEPPATKGYPPSVFAKLPKLVERAGNDAVGKGSITAFFTVLTEGDDQQDPIADSARAILDGHIVLSRDLAESGHYPAIDIESSISRVMQDLVDDTHFQRVQKLKQMLSRYQRNKDLINVGAYAAGSDPLLDEVIELYPQIEDFLRQPMHMRYDFTQSREVLDALFE